MTYDRAQLAMKDSNKGKRHSVPSKAAAGLQREKSPARRQSYPLQPDSTAENIDFPEITAPRTTPTSGMAIYREPSCNGSTDTEQTYRDFAGGGKNRNDNFIQDEALSVVSSGGSVDDRGRNMDINKQFRVDETLDRSMFSTTGSERSAHTKRRSRRDSESSSIDRIMGNGSPRRQSQSIDVEQNHKNQTVPILPTGDKNPQAKHQQTMFDKSIRTGNVVDIQSDKEDDTVPLKLPNVQQKCQHTIGNYELGKNGQFSKISKIKKEISDDDKCVICEITEATAQYASVEENRMLMEIVYPHDFYDKFQRSRRSRARFAESKPNTSTKDHINITKPAKFSPKLGRKDRGSTNSLTAGPETTDHQNTLRFSYRRCDTDRSEIDDLMPKKIQKKDTSNGFKKEIHVHCKAKSNAVVITDDSEGQKLVLKGLKGWLIKREDTCKSREHKELKKSLYQVNSLGIKFCIPEYNSSLHQRAQQSPRPATSYISSQDVPAPALRPDTHSIITRPLLSTQGVSRDNKNGVPRALGGIQRSYTFTPKLATSETVPVVADASANQKKSNTKAADLSLQRQKTNFSLPPIGLALKTKSLTISHF